MNWRGGLLRALLVVSICWVGVTAMTSASQSQPGSLPAGVTLQPIDGGPNYYADHGFTYAHNAGWDNPNFFPIGVWYAMILTQADASRWLDLGLNTAFRTTGNTQMSLLRSNGLFAVVSPGEYTGSIGAETVGLVAADEPGTYADAVTKPIGGTANSIQDGRFWYLNNTWNFINYGDVGRIPAASLLSDQVATPNGTKRHIDVQSVDIYWFAAGRADAGILYGAGLIYGLGKNMTADQALRACHNGEMIDYIRRYQAGHYPAPILGFQENGGPYTEDNTAAKYVTPAELNAGVWSNIIHGARMISYFNHTLAGPAQSNDNLRERYFKTVQPGQSTSIYAQTKATNALVKQLAPVINSPTALGYVTVTPTSVFPSLAGGFDVMAKYYKSQFYIFAMPRYSEALSAQTATFTVTDPAATTVSVVNENRTIPIANGKFADAFASANTVHIYLVN
jgi:hypothetical protein